MNQTYSNYTNNSKYTKLPHYPNVLQLRINMRAIFNLVKAMVFPVVMYGFQSWTVKKAEHQRIDAFEL